MSGLQLLWHKKKRTKTNKINSALLSFSTKEQFYNINMARYGVSQKFVPLISCTIIFDQNLFLHEISRRCLFLYREHMFRISVTGMPFLVFFFFITFCSRCGMEWDTACRPTDDPFWAFLSPGAQEPAQPPNNICSLSAAEKKYILGTKDNHPGPLLQQGFSTSSEIWDELSVTWQIK